MSRKANDALLLPELDRQVALHLIRNPSAKNEAISATLNVHINTIQPVAKRLKESILAESFHVLEWEAIGLGLRYRVDILINQRQLLVGGGPDDFSEFWDSMVSAGRRRNHAEKVNSQERLAKFIMHHLVDYVDWKLQRAIDAKQEKAKSTLTNFSERIYVEDVTILLGHQADLTAAVRVHNSDVIRRFVTDGLRLLGGVNSTSTSQEVWSSFEPPD